MIHFAQSAVAVVFTFGLVIFLHEFGHFLMCIKLGVRVERFAFGFGPELLGATHNGTRYSICLFPLGGFVKPAGDNLVDCTGEPNEYFSRPWSQRLAIVAAGPLMNYLLAFTLFFLVVFAKGMPDASRDPVIGEIETGYPAEQAGLRPEDRIVKVNAAAVSTWPELADRIHASPNKPVDLELLRGGADLRVRVVPRFDEVSGHGVIGIRPKIVYMRVGLLASAKEGLYQCWFQTYFTVTRLAEMIHKREHLDIAGPMGIVQMVHHAAHTGLEDLISLTALISVAIGFFNLLPIPLLDGGHAALYIVEGISRRKPSPNAQAVANVVGGIVLGSLLLYATYNDFLRTRQNRSDQRKAAPERAAPLPRPRAAH